MNVQVSHKHKIVAVPNIEAVRNLFPEARQLDVNGGTFLVVPHGQTETFMLRKLDLDVPSPILTYYDWPHPLGQEPFDVQKRTAALLTMSPRGYVLNGMGTGKTRSALWAWDYLRGNGYAGKLLVVAPLSTLSFTWAAEVWRTLPHRKCVVLHGAKKKRLERLADPDAEIFIINHDGVSTIKDQIDQNVDIDTIVIDELAVYRNGGTTRTKVIKWLANKLTNGKPRMQWVWGMTGSPIPTSPTDAWAQAQIVTPHTVPKFFGRFRDDVMVKVSQFKFVPKKDAVERAFAALQPAVRFSLDDVIELPELVDRQVDVEMGPKQAKVYKDVAAQCYAAVKEGEITAANAGAVMMKLLQVASGWVYTSEGKTAALDNDKRVEALVDAILASDRKVLVFAPFIHSLGGISAALTKEGLDHAVVSGETSATERNRIFTLFQSTSQLRVLVAHPQCLAHGITLTAADTIIWFAPVTSLEIYDQANARIRRIGQMHKQLILNLQSTPVEKKIYAMLKQKQDIQSKLLDLFEAATRAGAENV